MDSSCSPEYYALLDQWRATVIRIAELEAIIANHVTHCAYAARAQVAEKELAWVRNSIKGCGSTGELYDALYSRFVRGHTR